MSEYTIDKINYNSNKYLLKDHGIATGFISVETGVFNKLIATTLNAKDATIDNLTAKNATVVGLLDVQGEIHTKSWSNSNIATIDGSFYITPTSVSADGSDVTASGYTPTGTITYNASTTNYTEMVISGTFDTSQLTLDDVNPMAWTANSYVIVTGEVSVGREWYPLGTIRGKLQSQIPANNNAKTFTIIPIGTQIINNEVGNVSLTDGNGRKPAALEAIREAVANTSGASLTSLKLRNVKISMTSYANGNDQFALGIYMTAMGSNKKTFLDIYGGSEQNGINITNTIGSTTYNSGALAKPKVRIGNLLGLPKVGGIDPTGWGIYTSNGFFEGTVVASQGKIGNFTIANDLHSGTNGIGQDTNVYVSPGTQSSVDIAGSRIAEYQLTTDEEVQEGTIYYIYNVENNSYSIVTPAQDANPKSLGYYEKAETNRSWAFTAGNRFGVTTSGELFADQVQITGDIQASSLKITNINESGEVDVINVQENLITFGNQLNTLESNIIIDGANEAIQIGNSQNLHLILNKDKLSFTIGSGEDAIDVAYINDQQLYINQSVVLQQMDLGVPELKGGLGQWSWKVRPGINANKNNLNLKWIG